LSAQALVQPLIDTLLEEAGLIDELLAAAVEQREMVKSGDRLALQDMMKRVQNISFRVRAQEAQRVRLAQALAEVLGCEAHFSAIAGALAAAAAAADNASGKDAALFKGAGERLRHSVFALKSEMTILSGLIDQNERFSAMLLSEWRRLDAGFMRSGGLDFKG
jgi:hypothetical protein